MNKNPVCCCCRLLNWIISMAVMAIAAVGLWFFFGQPTFDEIKDLGSGLGEYLGDLNFTDFDFGDFTNVLDDIPGDLGGLFDNDPFAGQGPGDGDMNGSHWPNKGKGLTLELQMALDDSWLGEFAMAVDDWETGTPDALTLVRKDVAIDHTCRVVDGVMKVCNGNYGDSGWLGINEILQNTVDKEIQSSVAKMNEYYLLNADRYKRQFTMCHEIGHGFGLAHTDENFNNADLGNCLDYTRTPKNNLHPDETNFELLASMYGEVEDRRSRRRFLRRTSSFNDQLLKQYNDAIQELEHVQYDTKQPPFQWRVLREYSGGSHLVRKLNDEYTLEVHILHAIPFSDDAE